MVARQYSMSDKKTFLSLFYQQASKFLLRDFDFSHPTHLLSYNYIVFPFFFFVQRTRVDRFDHMTPLIKSWPSFSRHLLDDFFRHLFPDTFFFLYHLSRPLCICLSLHHQVPVMADWTLKNSYQFYLSVLLVPHYILNVVYKDKWYATVGTVLVDWSFLHAALFSPLEQTLCTQVCTAEQSSTHFSFISEEMGSQK